MDGNIYDNKTKAGMKNHLMHTIEDLQNEEKSQPEKSESNILKEHNFEAIKKTNDEIEELLIEAWNDLRWDNNHLEDIESMEILQEIYTNFKDNRNSTTIGGATLENLEYSDKSSSSGLEEVSSTNQVITETFDELSSSNDQKYGKHILSTESKKANIKMPGIY